MQDQTLSIYQPHPSTLMKRKNKHFDEKKEQAQQSQGCSSLNRECLPLISFPISQFSPISSKLTFEPQITKQCTFDTSFDLTKKEHDRIIDSTNSICGGIFQVLEGEKVFLLRATCQDFWSQRPKKSFNTASALFHYRATDQCQVQLLFSRRRFV